MKKLFLNISVSIDMWKFNWGKERLEDTTIVTLVPKLPL